MSGGGGGDGGGHPTNSGAQAAQSNFLDCRRRIRVCRGTRFLFLQSCYDSGGGSLISHKININVE